MNWNELTILQGACLLVVVVLGLTSIWAGTNSRHRLAIGLLTSAALLLRLFAATLDPFLNDWDEVYHAVVARNMAEHPLSPMLFKEASLPTTTSWAEQHFWLHKPPFFLWQMALCIKILGPIPLAVRLPSILWTVLMVPAVWRIGTLLRNERTGLVAAHMIAFSYLLQELVAGSINTDHNDAVFIGLIACTTWIWLEYVRRPSPWLAVAVGIMSAFAILTKWYIGGLLFLPFGLSIAFNRFKRDELMHFGMAAFAAIIPVGAWLWHINRWFPVESSYEVHENWLRWSTPIEGHQGGPLFHLDVIVDLIPPLTWCILLPVLTWLIWRVQATSHRILLVSTVAAVHLFFLLAQTKMVCYTMVLLPFYCVAMGNALVDISDRFSHALLAKTILVLSTVMLSYFSLDMSRIIARRSFQESPVLVTRWRKENIEVMDNLPKLARFLNRYPKAILFNMPRNQNYRFMFAFGIDSWPRPPKPEDVLRLKEMGYTVFVLQDGAVPDSFPLGTVLVPDSVFAIPKGARI